jgi:4-hydroxy-3-polyprenylbenzoate decarboxylase
MMSLWGAGLVALEKVLVVYDEGVDIQDPRVALDAVLRTLEPARDILILDQVPTDTLDHASPEQDLGSHVGIDATTPLPGEPARAPRPAVISRIALTADALRAHVPSLVDAHAPAERLLLVSVRKDHAGQARETCERLWKAGVDVGVVIVVFEASANVRDLSACVFHATANLDPARDVVRGGRGEVGVDATLKWPEEGARAWPPIIAMDAATKTKVDKRWPEYGL